MSFAKQAFWQQCAERRETVYEGTALGQDFWGGKEEVWKGERGSNGARTERRTSKGRFAKRRGEARRTGLRCGCPATAPLGPAKQGHNSDTFPATLSNRSRMPNAVRNLNRKLKIQLGGGLLTDILLLEILSCAFITVFEKWTCIFMLELAHRSLHSSRS